MVLCEKELQRNKYVYIMLIPVVLFYLIFSYGPMYGLLMAFQKSYSPIKGIMAGQWIGFDNFKMFLKATTFGGLLRTH